MSTYTVDEKLEYHNRKRSEFSWGYIFGVKEYRSYKRASRQRQAEIREDIDDSLKRAKKGSKYDKGFICGVRDAANERKHK